MTLGSQNKELRRAVAKVPVDSPGFGKPAWRFRSGDPFPRLANVQRMEGNDGAEWSGWTKRKKSWRLCRDVMGISEYTVSTLQQTQEIAGSK